MRFSPTLGSGRATPCSAWAGASVNRGSGSCTPATAQRAWGRRPAMQGKLLACDEALPLSDCKQSVGSDLAEAANHAQAEADAVLALAVVLQGAVPVAVAHGYRPGFDAVAAGVLQYLVGAGEGHRPAV